MLRHPFPALCLIYCFDVHKGGICEQMCGSFLGQSVVLTGLTKRGGETTSNFSSLLSVEATCGIWQLEEGGDDSFLSQLRGQRAELCNPSFTVV